MKFYNVNFFFPIVKIDVIIVINVYKPMITVKVK